MEGKLKISKEEVRVMVEAWLNQNVFTQGIRIIQIKAPGYSAYEPDLEVEYTNEPEIIEGGGREE